MYNAYGAAIETNKKKITLIDARVINRDRENANLLADLLVSSVGGITPMSCSALKAIDTL